MKKIIIPVLCVVMGIGLLTVCKKEAGSEDVNKSSEITTTDGSINESGDNIKPTGGEYDGKELVFINDKLYINGMAYIAPISEDKASEYTVDGKIENKVTGRLPEKDKEAVNIEAGTEIYTNGSNYAIKNKDGLLMVLVPLDEIGNDINNLQYSKLQDGSKDEYDNEYYYINNEKFESMNSYVIKNTKN